MEQIFPSIPMDAYFSASQNGGSDHESDQLFLQAYDDYAEAIFRHCALRLSDREVAKDLMQDTFMKTWSYLQKGKKVDNIRAFLYKTANNLIIDTVRRNSHRQHSSLEDMQEAGFDIGDEKPSDHMKNRVDGSIALEMLHSIEEPYQTALILRYVDDLQPREIAELLEVSPNVVSVRLHRGLEKLRSLSHSPA